MLKRGLVVVACLGALSFSDAHAASPDPAAASIEIVAKVDGFSIERDQFEATLAQAARQKFYHGKVEDGKMAAFRKEVINQLITERLVQNEIERRKIAPNAAEVDRNLADYDERYKGSEMWAAQRERVLPELRAKLAANSQRKILEASVREVAPPTPKDVETFYKANPQLFTEPEQNRVSIILLKVDPSSTKDVWVEAQAEGLRIANKIRGGADFASLAKLHSADASSAKGGDMGYLHQGMLAPEAEKALAKMVVGEISDPVETLQGYIVIKLSDRKVPTLRSLEDVRERAGDLYRRQKAEANWSALLDQLRKKADIWISPTIAVAVEPAR